MTNRCTLGSTLYFTMMTTLHGTGELTNSPSVRLGVFAGCGPNHCMLLPLRRDTAGPAVRLGVSCDIYSSARPREAATRFMAQRRPAAPPPG